MTYDIEKDVENVAKFLAEREEYDSWEECVPAVKDILSASTAVKELKELQERYDALVRDEWQPIKSAPREGYFLTVETGALIPFVVEYDSIDEEWVSFNQYFERTHKRKYNPAHWKPLTPPKGK